MKRKVRIIYTGGTIGMEKNNKTGSLQPFDFQNAKDRIPEMNLLDCHITLSQFENPLDSSDIGPKQWKQIATDIRDNYENYNGFLILHGTDTMAYTASALSFMLKGLKKPVILTGSQLPIGDIRTDAKENLLTSLYYASYYQNKKAVIQEVALYFEYKLLRGNRCLKASAENFDAFQSPNYPILGQSGVHLEAYKSTLWREKKIEFSIDTHISEKVFFLRIFPGINLEYMENFILSSQIKVLILQVFGSGTFFSDKKSEKILEKIRKNNVEIVIVSQCNSGEISIGKYDNSNIFKAIGAISGKDITVESAIAKSMHILDNPNYPNSFRTHFSENLRGEISN